MNYLKLFLKIIKTLIKQFHKNLKINRIQDTRKIASINRIVYQEKNLERISKTNKNNNKFNHLYKFLTIINNL